MADGRRRHWSDGPPAGGLHVRGVGPTRAALAPLIPVAIGLGVEGLVLAEVRHSEDGVPVLTGQLTDAVGWPAIVYDMAAVGVLALVAAVIVGVTLWRWGRPFVTRDRPPGAPSARHDPPGAR